MPALDRKPDFVVKNAGSQTVLAIHMTLDEFTESRRHKQFRLAYNTAFDPALGAHVYVPHPILGIAFVATVVAAIPFGSNSWTLTLEWMPTVAST